MNKKPIVQVWEKLGLLPQQITPPSERGVAAPADSRSSTGYANQAAVGKTPTAEEWWIKTAAILCQKADQSGVIDFRITKVEGKWVFEITPEEQPDSHTDQDQTRP